MSDSDATRLAKLPGRFAKTRLLVVGDLMLDQFIWGRVERISPEAPVPVVHVQRESFHPGGAANVVRNVAALGGKVGIVGVVGRDASGKRVVSELDSCGVDVSGVVEVRDWETIRKTRIIAHQQQVVRLDREGTIPGERVVRAIVDKARKLAKDYDGIIVSDYAKGVVSPMLLEWLAARAGEGARVFIDPKKGNFARYRGATLLKPNREAASLASGVEIVDEESLRRAGKMLLETWEARAILISRGAEGMSLFVPGKAPRHIETAAQEVYDVTGAGDTVMATAALAIAAGGGFHEAAVLANLAAGIVVGKVGTATVALPELRAAIRAMK